MDTQSNSTTASEKSIGELTGAIIQRLRTSRSGAATQLLSASDRLAKIGSLHHALFMAANSLTGDDREGLATLADSIRDHIDELKDQLGTIHDFLGEDA